MAKPIFILTLPHHLTLEEHQDTEKRLSKKLYDYHVLIVQDDVKNVEAKCFYEKDFKEVNLEELKAIVKKTLL